MRIQKLVALGVLVLVIILAVAIYGILRFIPSRQLKAEISKIKARGEPVSWADLAGDRIPDAENAAVVYAQAFKVISGPDAEEEFDTLARFLSPEKREKNPKLWDDARRIVTRYRKALPLANEAVSRPKCRFPVNWEDGLEAEFPHLRNLQRLARLLSANAVLNATDGRMGESVRSVELGFKVSKSLEDEPWQISQIARTAIIKIVARSLRDALQHGDITEKQARRLFDRLAQIDLSEGFVRALVGERAMSISYFHCLREHPRAASEPAAHNRSDSKVASKPTERTSYLWRLVMDASELHYLETMNAYIKAARKPYREIKSIGLDAEPKLPRYALMSAILLPGYGHCAAQRDNGVAEIAGSRIFLALHVYHHRFDSYPETLDELRAKLQWEIPKDIFSGKDFVYERQDKGFLLYSIGADLKDDGGRVPPAKPRGAMTAEERARDDIIWQLEG